MYLPWYSTRLVYDNVPVLDMCHWVKTFAGSNECVLNKLQPLCVISLFIHDNVCKSLQIEYSGIGIFGKYSTSLWNSVKWGIGGIHTANVIEHYAWLVIQAANILLHVTILVGIILFVMCCERSRTGMLLSFSINLLSFGVSLLLLSMLIYTLPCPIAEVRYGLVACVSILIIFWARN